MNAEDACRDLARWLALRRQALPLQEALPGLSPAPGLDACLALWQGEDLLVHAFVADAGGDPERAGGLAEALRRALELGAPRVPGRIRACLHCVTQAPARARELRQALLSQVDGHFLSKVLVGRSVLCLQDGSADYSGRAGVEPSAQDLAAVLADASRIPDATEATQWQSRRWQEQQALQALLQPGPTPLTWALIAANVAVFGVQLAYAQRLQSQGLSPGAAEYSAMVELGCNQAWSILSQGHYGRLFSTAFLHGGVLHLGMNMAALYSLGSLTERLIGPWRLGLLYLLAILLSSLMSSLFLPVGVPSVGASGAILGLAGLLLAPHFRRDARFPQALATRLFQWLARPMALLFGIGLAFRFLNLGLQFDNAAHLGGLLTGLALGYLFPSYLVRSTRR